MDSKMLNAFSVLMAEDTDDETGQVLQGMDTLPPVLRRYVREDNRWFQQELREWEEQFCQVSQEELSVPSAHSNTSSDKIISENTHPNLETTPELNQDHALEATEEPDMKLAQEPYQKSEGQLLFSSR